MLGDDLPPCHHDMSLMSAIISFCKEYAKVSVRGEFRNLSPSRLTSLIELGVNQLILHRTSTVLDVILTGPSLRQHFLDHAQRYLGQVAKVTDYSHVFPENHRFFPRHENIDDVSFKMNVRPVPLFTLQILPKSSDAGDSLMKVARNLLENGI